MGFVALPQPKKGEKYPEVGSVTTTLPSGITDYQKAIEYGQVTGPTIVPRISGGGGAVSLTPSQAAAQAAAAEAARKLEEQKRLEEERKRREYLKKLEEERKISEAKAFAGTLAGQVLTRGPAESEKAYGYRVGQLTKAYGLAITEIAKGKDIKLYKETFGNGYYEPEYYTQERKAGLAAALQAGKEVYYTPTGAEIISKEWAPAKEGAFGLGGRFVYKGEKGEIIGEETNVLQASDIKTSLIWRKAKESVLGGYEKLNIGLRERITYPVFGAIEKLTGIDITTTKGAAVLTPSLIGVGPLGLKPKPEEDILAGVSAGVLKEVKEKPAKYVALVGAGYGAGFAVGGVSAGLAAIPKAGPVASSLFKGATIGAGIYLGAGLVTTTTGRIIAAPTPAEKGAIFGVTALEIGAVGLGYVKGQKTFTQFQGWLRTRGGQDITAQSTDPLVEKGIKKFPEAGERLSVRERAALHKKIFVSQELYKTLGVKKGGIHAAAEEWTSEELTRALHIAPRVSTHFLEIEGAKYKMLPGIKDLLAPTKKPGILYIEAPKGFKVLPGIEYKRGFYKWFGKLTGGEMAYLPGTKAEVQAVFDPRVTLGLKEVPMAGKFYIVTKGVRVPFVGAYTPITAAPVGEAVLSVSKFGKIVSSYSAVAPSYPIITPSAVGISSLVSRVYRPYKPSYAPPVVSYVPTPYYYKAPVYRTRQYISKISGYGVSSALSSIMKPSAYVSPVLGISPITAISKYSVVLARKPPVTPLRRIRFREKAKRIPERYVPEYIYQPSFTGSILQLKAKAPPYLAGALRLRPVIRGQRAVPRAPRRITLTEKELKLKRKRRKILGV